MTCCVPVQQRQSQRSQQTLKRDDPEVRVMSESENRWETPQGVCEDLDVRFPVHEARQPEIMIAVDRTLDIVIPIEPGNDGSHEQGGRSDEKRLSCEFAAVGAHRKRASIIGAQRETADRPRFARRNGTETLSPPRYGWTPRSI